MQLIKKIAFLVICAATITLKPVEPNRPWTLFVYIAADNNLWQDADLNIEQMRNASYSPNIHIAVYLNIKRPGEIKKTERLWIHDGIITTISLDQAQDSGSEATFLKAMQWALNEFPSDYLLIDVWDHGSGSLNRDMHQQRGICYDDTTGHYLTDKNYKNAFETIVQERAGKKIDIIAFDACLMACLEVAYTLIPLTDYVVSSEQTVPAAGFNYTDLLNFFTQEVPQPREMSQFMVESYQHYYKESGYSYTLSAIDSNAFTQAVHAFNELSVLLRQYLKQNPYVKKIIKNSASHYICPHFDEFTYIDLARFYQNIYSRLTHLNLTMPKKHALKVKLEYALDTLLKSVIANCYSSDFSRVGGVSIYFPDPFWGIEASYYNLYWSESNPAWINFLSSYLYFT